MAEYKSKTVIVRTAPMALFDRIVDLKGVTAVIPEEQKKDVVVDGDTISITYAGFTIAVKIAEKVPFSKVVFEDVEAPFHFRITLNLEPGEAPMETLFNINVDADLNFMMKTLLGGKIQEFLDKTVTAVSTGEIL